MRNIRTLTTLALLAVAASAAGLPASAGPERLWLTQATPETTEGNAGAMQLQTEIVDKLKRIGIDYPAGQYMTLDQVNRLSSLFNQNEDEASTRSEARAILGM